MLWTIADAYVYIQMYVLINEKAFYNGTPCTQNKLYYNKTIYIRVHIPICIPMFLYTSSGNVYKSGFMFNLY